VVGDAASALWEVDGEGNIYINVGKERKPGRIPGKRRKRGKETIEVVVA
jgi:hypothetical protein